jgi:hypothetical protein
VKIVTGISKEGVYLIIHYCSAYVIASQRMLLAKTFGEGISKEQLLFLIGLNLYQDGVELRSMDMASRMINLIQ